MSTKDTYTHVKFKDGSALNIEDVQMTHITFGHYVVYTKNGYTYTVNPNEVLYMEYYKPDENPPH